MRPIIDIILFNNEMDLLDLRVKILEDVVDGFVIKESPVTFQGTPKDCIGQTYQHPKVRSVVIDIPPHLTGWEREYFVRSVHVDVPDNGLILNSDIDEIPNPQILQLLHNVFDDDTIYTFEMMRFMYYLNVRQLWHPWCGTRASSADTYHRMNAQMQRDATKDHRPLPNHVFLRNGGWHWSFVMSPHDIEQKLKSYSHVERNTTRTRSKVAGRRENLQDIFGGHLPLEVTPLDERFPDYVRHNQKTLDHLIWRPGVDCLSYGEEHRSLQ